ncbi:hypothetical protein ACRAWF_06795 [Streptomyces sp. L7]
MPLPEGSVGALVAFLVSHLDWLTSFAAAPDFAAEVAGLRSRAERVTRKCHCHYPSARSGQLRQAGVRRPAHRPRGSRTLGRFDDRLRPRTHLAATGVADSVGPLGRGGNIMSSAPRRRRVSTELAALAAGVAPATIRRWVRRGKLTRYGSPNRAEFDIAELLAVARRGEG